MSMTSSATAAETVSLVCWWVQLNASVAFHCLSEGTCHQLSVSIEYSRTVLSDELCTEVAAAAAAAAAAASVEAVVAEDEEGVVGEAATAAGTMGAVRRSSYPPVA